MLGIRIVDLFRLFFMKSNFCDPFDIPYLNGHYWARLLPDASSTTIGFLLKILHRNDAANLVVAASHHNLFRYAFPRWSVGTRKKHDCPPWGDRRA